MEVKTYDCYFRNAWYSKIYLCSVWARSEDHMKQMIEQKFGKEKPASFAFVETHRLQGDVSEEESPVPLMMVEEINKEFPDEPVIKKYNFNKADFE